MELLGPVDPPWEGLHIIEVVYGEFLGAVAAPESLEACYGHTGGARHKLEQSESLLVVKALHCLPEPQHHLVGSMLACMWGACDMHVHKVTGYYASLSLSLPPPTHHSYTRY